MSSETQDATPIESVDQLVEWIAAGCKPAEQHRIGTEHEKFPFYTESLEPVPYEGEKGIRALLEGMAKATGWERGYDDGRIVSLKAPDGAGISLEPGGQFELSGAPLETIHETCAESNQHLAVAREVGGAMGISFLGMGSSPVWSMDRTPRMPRSRYEIMRGRLAKAGAYGPDMMHRSTTIQVNLDYASEADMRRKMQVSLKLQPVAAALFANSPFSEGRPNGFVSIRSEMWRDVDNGRAGTLPIAYSPEFGFADYVEWALDIPMFFVVRGSEYVEFEATFRQFMAGELPADMAGRAGEPTMGDWINHLGFLFPDVRLKRFLEMRGADGGPWRRICALPALWVGLLYDPAALDEAEALTRDWTHEAVAAMRDAVPREGLRAAAPNGQSVHEAARDALHIAERGLAARAKLNAAGLDETDFLAPLAEVVAKGRTKAEDLLARYEGPWKHRIEPLFEEMAF